MVEFLTYLIHFLNKFQDFLSIELASIFTATVKAIETKKHYDILVSIITALIIYYACKGFAISFEITMAFASFIAWSGMDRLETIINELLNYALQKLGKGGK